MTYRTFHAIQVGPLHLRTWGLLVGLGLAAGLFAAAWAARKRGLAAERLFGLAFVGVLAGIVGSRLLWAVQPAEIGETLRHPLRLISFWEPGLTLIGGLVFGFGAAIVYAWRTHVPLRATLDAVAIGVGPAVAIGRVGCFLTGLHPGKPTTLPWGIYWLGASRHPIPLYESLLGVALFVLAILLYRRHLVSGAVSLAVGIFYLVGRSLIDLLRVAGLSGSDPRLLGGLTLTQTVSLVVVPVLGAGLVWACTRRKADRLCVQR